MLFQYGGHNWGDNHADFTRNPNADLRMRLAYIDWTLPGTEIKARVWVVKLL